MENAQVLVNAISSVGFPIVVTLILLWMITQEQQAHKAESEKMTEAINNNTIALTKLMDRMDVKN